MFTIGHVPERAPFDPDQLCRGTVFGCCWPTLDWVCWQSWQAIVYPFASLVLSVLPNTGLVGCWGFVCRVSCVWQYNPLIFLSLASNFTWICLYLFHLDTSSGVTMKNGTRCWAKQDRMLLLSVWKGEESWNTPLLSLLKHLSLEWI